MKQPIETEDRRLRVAERELVALTRPTVLAKLSEAELRELIPRLRAARDRARVIARQQQREMRSKAAPRGARPARDNTGSVAKTEVLVVALKRVTEALRKLKSPTQGELARKALAKKRAAATTDRPAPGKTATKGMSPKASTKRAVKVDPRQVGRVSQAGKRAQARRDRQS
jgi:hypothetical protein